VFYELPGKNITSAAIRRELSKLFPIHMQTHTFVPTREFPRDPSAKLDRNGLPGFVKALP